MQTASWYAPAASQLLREFYCNVTGVLENPIDKVHARVVLPGGVTPTLTAVYTGAADSKAKDARIDRNGDVVDFTMLRGLNPYEGMTIGVGWPAGSITSRPSESRERVASAAQWTPLAIPFIVFFLVFKYWQRRGRDPKEGSTAVQYEPLRSIPRSWVRSSDNTPKG